jgi:hypothetical protein
VALLSERHFKPLGRFFIPNCQFYRTDRFSRRKGGTAAAVRKSIPRNYIDLPPLVSIESTEAYMPIDNCEVLLEAVTRASLE